MGMTHRTPCRQSTVWGSSMVLYAILLLSRSSLQHRMMGRPYETQDFYFLGERCRKIIITWKVHHWLHNCHRIKENFLKKKKIHPKSFKICAMNRNYFRIARLWTSCHFMLRTDQNSNKNAHLFI